jgi:hypothetical protein
MTKKSQSTIAFFYANLILLSYDGWLLPVESASVWLPLRRFSNNLKKYH